MSEKGFEIKLPLFEGPFDLLLFFIERDELDIYDIPISRITKEFLNYLENLERLNIEIASEFILVAAKLMRIKAKMLLPRPSLDEEGNEIDPREELVRHLLEYKKYKSILSEFSRLEDERLAREARGNILREIKEISSQSNLEAEFESVDLYKLLRVYERVLERFKEAQNKPRHTVVEYPYTISSQKDFLMRELSSRETLSFEDIIEAYPNKIGVIFNFLAILELLQLSVITMTIGEGFNNFWIRKTGEVLTES